MLDVRRSDGLAGALLGAVLGYIYFAYIFPRGFLGGTSDFWQSQVSDLAQYQTGYTAFLREPWHFPLLHISSINWPGGTLITYMDAIPGMALLLKAFGPLAPANPYGYWVALCFVLQGVAAWWILREARVRSWVILVLCVVLYVTMAALSIRLGHIALMSHFLILGSLALYARDRYEPPSWWRWGLLLLIAFYVSIYIALMAGLIAAASAVDSMLKSRSLRAAVPYLLALVPVALTIPLTAGLGGLLDHESDGGYGIFSMNLLAPLEGGSILHLPFYKPGTWGQYEGRNTLGLGLLVLVVAALFSRSRPRLRVGLGVVLAAFAIYSLSNEVYVSDFHLLSVSLPPRVIDALQNFRATGRFFWPVGYALVAFGCIALARWMPRARLLVWGFAAIVMILQIADLSAIRQGTWQAARRPVEFTADAAAVHAALDGVRIVYQYPKLKCGKTWDNLADVMTMAIDVGASINTGYVTRARADCDSMPVEIATSDPATSAYMFVTSEITPEAARQAAPPSVTCRPFARWTLCRVPRD